MSREIKGKRQKEKGKRKAGSEHRLPFAFFPLTFALF
jgi:hypothetical protein